MPEAIACSGSHFHSAAFRGLIEVVIGSPLPDLRLLLGHPLCAWNQAAPFLSHLLAFAHSGPPSAATDKVGEGFRLSVLGMGGRERISSPRAREPMSNPPPW